MRGLNLILFSLLSFLLLSCQEQKKESITTLVTEWQDKSIIFPDKCVFTKLATDTIDFSFSDSSYKILTYIDSTGCVNCKLQLPRWKELITQIDSISNKSVAFLFFFHPKSYKEIRNILRQEHFDYPVCIDEMNQLDLLNHFPKKFMFQTFLLDKENKVRIIGNPIHNLSVQDLYIKQIQESDKKTPYPNTELKVNQTEHNIGIVSLNSTTSRIITLHNNGNYPFHIKALQLLANAQPHQSNGK